MSYPITDLDGIDADVAKIFKSIGIRTTDKFLAVAKDVRGRKSLAAKTGLSEAQILRWANLADGMRIKGMAGGYAALLQEIGVTVKRLPYRNPAKLAEAMAAANKTKKLVRVLPSDQAIERWIDQAKKLPPIIKH